MKSIVTTRYWFPRLFLFLDNYKSDHSLFFHDNYRSEHSFFFHDDCRSDHVSKMVLSCRLESYVTRLRRY